MAASLRRTRVLQHNQQHIFYVNTLNKKFTIQKGNTKFKFPLSISENLINQSQMKKAFLVIAIITTAFITLPACKKNKGGGGGTTEANLVVETTPANGSVQPAAPGPDFPLKVEIKSTMPASGVKIEISAKKEGSSDPAYFTASPNSSTAVNNFTITSTPKNVTCLVDIKVTSISKPSNVWTGSYRYSAK